MLGMCQVTELSKLNLKKKNVYAKSIDFWKKKSVRTCDLLNASQLFYPSSHMAVVFDGMLLKFFPLHLQPAAERNLITAFTRGDKLEVGRWWVNDVRQLICRCGQSQVSYRRDGWMDRQTDGFSALYIEISIHLQLKWSPIVQNPQG